MKKHLIIRGLANGGKTTTCGVLYEELIKEAEFSKLYNYRFEEIECLSYNSQGDLMDFIAIIIINSKVIIIVSKGDVANWLKEILDKLEKEDFIMQLTNNRCTYIDFLVVCARSQMRTNSTIEMLYNRIPKNQRKDFWTTKSDNIKDKKVVKAKVVKEMIAYIKTN